METGDHPRAPSPRATTSTRSRSWFAQLFSSVMRSKNASCTLRTLLCTLRPSLRCALPTSFYTSHPVYLLLPLPLLQNAESAVRRQKPVLGPGPSLPQQGQGQRQGQAQKQDEEQGQGQKLQVKERDRKREGPRLLCRKKLEATCHVCAHTWASTSMVGWG